FENIALCLLIISLEGIFQLLTTKHIKKSILLISVFSAVLACLLRPHILSIYLFLIFLAILSGIFLKNRFYLKLGLLYALIIFVFHVPIFYQNYKDFGSLFLSTQPSLEFFQGHNPFARGSWQPGIWDKHKDELQKMFAQEPNLPYLNEKEELDFYKKQAIQWILENPEKELLLILRKTAILFLPYNFLDKNFSIFLLVTYVGFIGFLVLFTLNIKQIMQSQEFIFLLILLIPFIAVYFLNIYFFVGERWRYYGEPFMLILAIYFYKRIYLQIFRRKTQNV
ncbi:MAG: hypothetical protein RMJ97_12025, partial [Raineya sp.]|nr:hypothetical protein [Raineya sp.]